jgi:hypothetical protein
MNQYKHAADSYSKPMTDDPLVAQSLKREPISRFVEVAMIGGGVGGLVAAAHLVKAGLTTSSSSKKEGILVAFGIVYPGIVAAMVECH